MMDIFQRRAWVRAWANRSPDKVYPDQYRSKAIVSVRLSMGDYIPNSDLHRQVLGWLFLDSGDWLSTSKLTDGQIDALKHWLKILPSGEGWTICAEAAGELRQMGDYLESGKQYGPVVEQAVKMGGMIDGKLPEPAKPRYYEFE